jgi:hypothetical protein
MKVAVALSLLAVSAWGCGGPAAGDTGGCPFDGAASGSEPTAVEAGPADRFVGRWQYVSGTFSYLCNDGRSGAQPPSGVQTFARGTDSDLEIVGGNCLAKFNVSGDDATALPGQSCALMNCRNNTTTTFTGLSWKFTLQGATTMQAVYTEQSAVTDADGNVVLTCSYTLQGTLVAI